jgi:type IV pilus assembly protein PilB
LSPLPGHIGSSLVQREIITQGQLAEALMQQSQTGERVGAILVRLGALDEQTLTAALAGHLGRPVVDLRKERPEKDAVALLPESLARDLIAIPLSLAGGRLRIAVADPGNGGLEERLKNTTGTEVELVMAPASDIQRTINGCYSALAAIHDYVDEYEASESIRRPSPATPQPATDGTSAQGPIVQIVNLIVTQAVRDRTSDVHIEPQDERLRIRYRIDGALHEVLSLPAGMASALVSRIKVMAEMNIVERRRSQDGQFRTEIDGHQLDVRVATTSTIWGEKCVLRLLDKSRSVFKLHELGMPHDTAAMYSGLIRSPFGMVLCAGPTGSGKTTTLYATLSEINEPYRNIMTIEDPVEYVFPSINQIQTNEQAGITFADGLRSILRQDPDVILVGEVRDVETARIAVQSALTGHFVLSSLHATDSAAALHRFLDMGIESFLIASSVIAVVAQRLLRRICPECRAPYDPSDEELA